MNQESITRIFDVAKTEPKSVEHLLLKLMEEVGEASQAYLSTTKASGSVYKQLTQENFQEELVDSLLVLLTLIKRSDISEIDLELLINQKVTKWQEKQDK